MSSREFQSVNALLKDLSSPQFVFDLIDLIDLIVSLERLLIGHDSNHTVSFTVINKIMLKKNTLCCTC